MQQKTFSLDDNGSYEYGDFIESSSNRIAYNHIQNWPNNFGVLPYSKTLIIKGPKSSGKSFLAHLWVKKTNALVVKKNYELTSSILEHHQAFLIDGFDENWHEEDVLHYFNILNENSKYLLITMNQMPKVKLPDLSSRLNSVNKIDILTLDDELMRILIFKQFSNFSIKVNEEVINYLIKTLPREFPRVQNGIKILNQLSLERKRKITILFVKENLHEILE